MAAHASLLISLVRLLAVCLYLRIKEIALASPKCLAFMFGGGMISVSFRQLFLLMIFYFYQLFFAGDINYKLVVTLQGGIDEERKKRLENEGPSVTDEVHFLNNTVDC